MRRIRYISITIAILVAPAVAAAQSLGGGALPTLRTTLIETSGASRQKKVDDDGDGVSQAVVIGVAGGYTSNAGPTLDPQPSPLLETSVLVLHARPLGEGHLSLQADLTAREFTSFNTARTTQYALKGTYAPKDNAWSAALATEKRVDIEEEVNETSLTVSREWRAVDGGWTPYVRGSLAYLDYADINLIFLEFANQDDRDRVSTSVETGAKFRTSGNITMTIAAGADVKRYAAARDDFLLDRNNVSSFVSLGAAYDDPMFSGLITYAPVYRVFDESIFRPLIAHTFNAQAVFSPSDAVKLFANARLGLEETDFLAAKVVEERVAAIGVTVTWPDSVSSTLEAAYTNRKFDGVGRDDHKYEIQLRAQAPLTDKLKLTAQAGYLLFNSNLGDISTDQTAAMLGMVYTLQ